jgi:hypothetical protein
MSISVGAEVDGAVRIGGDSAQCRNGCGLKRRVRRAVCPGVMAAERLRGRGWDAPGVIGWFGRFLPVSGLLADTAT